MHLLESVKALTKLLITFRKAIEKKLTTRTVNELVTLITHAIVFLTVEAFIALLILTLIR